MCVTVSVSDTVGMRAISCFIFLLLLLLLLLVLLVLFVVVVVVGGGIDDNAGSGLPALTAVLHGPETLHGPRAKNIAKQN